MRSCQHAMSDNGVLVQIQSTPFLEFYERPISSWTISNNAIKSLEWSGDSDTTKSRLVPTTSIETTRTGRLHHLDKLVLVGHLVRSDRVLVTGYLAESNFQGSPSYSPNTGWTATTTLKFSSLICKVIRNSNFAFTENWAFCRSSMVAGPDQFTLIYFVS